MDWSYYLYFNFETDIVTISSFRLCKILLRQVIFRKSELKSKPIWMKKIYRNGSEEKR